MEIDKNIPNNCVLLIDIVSIYGQLYQCMVKSMVNLTYQNLLNVFQSETGYQINSTKSATNCSPCQLFIMDRDIITRANMPICVPDGEQHIKLKLATTTQVVDDECVFKHIEDNRFGLTTNKMDVDEYDKMDVGQPDDTIRFNYYSVENTEPESNPNMYIKSKSSNPFQIFIKGIVNGKIITLNDIFPETTGYEIKQFIEDKCGIPICHQRICYSNRQILDENDMKSYNIEKDATIMFNLRLKGGMFHESSGRNNGYDTCKVTYFTFE